MKLKGTIPPMTTPFHEVIVSGKAVADLGAAALQITPVHCLFTPDEQAMYDYYARMSIV